MDKIRLGARYVSRVNRVAYGCTYEVIKKLKTVCWVRLWEDGVVTERIYKGVPYRVLGREVA